MNKLKPCPFCGSEYHVEHKRWNEWTNRIECNSCYCRTEHFATKKEAVKLWNTRPIEGKQAEEIARLKEELAEFLIDLVNQHCQIEDGTLDSMALSANADAMYRLAELGNLKIIKSHGRRVIGKFILKGETE